MRSPLHVEQADLAGSRRGRRVLEELALDVSVEAHRLGAKVRHEEARPPGAEGVPHRHAHSRARVVAQDAGAGLPRRLFERPVALVPEEAVGDPVVDEVEVGPPVAVVVEDGNPQRLHMARIDCQPCRLRDVAPLASALVVEEVRGLADVVLGDAELELRLRGLPLGSRVEVVGDGDVYAAVAVVVEKRRAHREERVFESGVFALFEGAVALVPIDDIGADVRQVQVELSVAVQVHPEGAHSEPACVNAGLLRHVVELSAAPVAVEAPAVLRVRLPPVRDGIGHVEVGQAVAVVVAEGAPAVHRGNELETPQIGGIPKPDAGALRDVAEHARLRRGAA
ncbi:MAG TPA: hypothetical protein VGS00_11315 [Thermoanaerobaculia bacterium]|nr:hypothetical protein [Thermoanaerobaculia bacterium]